MNGTINKILKKACKQSSSLSREEIKALLSATGSDQISEILRAAENVKKRSCQSGVAIRGIIEAGNACTKDCFYCGIRKSNTNVSRYIFSEDQIVDAAENAHRAGFHSIVIQSGEIESKQHTSIIEKALRRIAPLNLGVTLSLGEQTFDTLERWRAAGASRYLLRIETSSPELYRMLHPQSCSWERRKECLVNLGRLKYQVGTGVMISLPGQTLDSLADDILFFKKINADMIGMGPYIPHCDTPLASSALPQIAKTDEELLMLSLKMIAVTRLFLHDINIAAATALLCLDPNGRTKAIKAGANVIMPNVTADVFAKEYNLYSGKIAVEKDLNKTMASISSSLAEIGEHLILDNYGDSLHYKPR
jgi:biotin synthase